VLFKERGLKPSDNEQFTKTRSGRYRISKSLLQVSKAHSLQCSVPPLYCMIALRRSVLLCVRASFIVLHDSSEAHYSGIADWLVSAIVLHCSQCDTQLTCSVLLYVFTIHTRANDSQCWVSSRTPLAKQRS
jgi:hypothetical protein